jgi:hypothetical protein
MRQSFICLFFYSALTGLPWVRVDYVYAKINCMRSVHFICLLCLLSLAACQKELSWENGTTPAGDSTLLTSIVTTNQQNDSTVMSYTYNSNRQVTGRSYSGKDTSVQYNQQLSLVRDNSGRITQVKGTVTLATLLPGGIPAGTLPANADSTVQFTKYVHYPGNSKNFDYTTDVYQVSGFTISDSTLFTYSADNRVIKSVTYLSAALVPGFPAATFLIDSMVYAYDGQGNLTSSKIYGSTDLTAVNANLVLGVTNTYEYGAQPNPLMLGNEAFLFDNEIRSSPNILVTQTTTGDFEPATQTYSAFTFSATHQLVQTADLTTVDDDGTTVYKVKYYYK